MIFPNLKELIKLKQMILHSQVLQNNSANRMQGDYASLFHGLGVEFETVRPYVIGDDVRYIDWRVSARSGVAHVKTFRAECDRNVLIVVDANSYMRFGTRGTFKSVQAAHTAALLSWKSLQLQDRVGALVFGDVLRGIQYFKPQKSDGSILRMLKLLCNQDINVNGNISVASALGHVAKMVTPQTLIFIISDFSLENSQDLEQACVLLRKKCTVVLVPVHDPADSFIPAIGPITLVHDQDRIIINTDNVQAQQEYNEMWQQYHKQITQLSKKLNMPLIWIDTNIDPSKALMLKLAAGDGRFN